MPAYMRPQDALSLTFTKIGIDLHVKLHEPAVKGFEAGAEPTAEDAASVARALDDLYDGLPGTQQQILQRLVQLAADAPE